MPHTQQETPHKIKSVQLFWNTIKAVGAQSIFLYYLLFLALLCALISFVEPTTFPTFYSAVWYCFQVITTIGFGDNTPVGIPAQLITIVMGMSSLFIVALITGVVVNFFNERISMMRNDSFIEFGYRMTHLTQLNPEQLANLERDFKTFIEHHESFKSTIKK